MKKKQNNFRSPYVNDESKNSGVDYCDSEQLTKNTESDCCIELSRNISPWNMLVKALLDMLELFSQNWDV